MTSLLLDSSEELSSDEDCSVVDSSLVDSLELLVDSLVVSLLFDVLVDSLIDGELLPPQLVKAKRVKTPKINNDFFILFVGFPFAFNSLKLMNN